MRGRSNFAQEIIDLNLDQVRGDYGLKPLTKPPEEREPEEEEFLGGSDDDHEPD